MDGSDGRAERTAGVARDLRTQHKDPQGTYQVAAQVAHVNVDGCDGASLSIVRHRKAIETVAATNSLAAQADGLQYELGEGPCLDVLWEQPTVYTPDLANDARWPIWGPRAVEGIAVRSLVSYRVFTHEDSLGVLNVYSRGLDAFDNDAQLDGAAIAAQVAIAVAAAHDIGDLSAGMDSRAVVGQATGILMGRFHLNADEAFRVLARYSSSSQTKLREVAADVVRTGVIAHLDVPRGRGDTTAKTQST